MVRSKLNTAMELCWDGTLRKVYLGPNKQRFWVVGAPTVSRVDGRFNRLMDEIRKMNAYSQVDKPPMK